MSPPIASRQATPTAVRRLRQLTAALLTLLAAAALGGCGGSEQPGGTGGATATTATPAPTVSAPTTSEPVVLADGRHPVYLKTVDPDRQTITFDLIQFFTGDAATKAAAEDGEESPPPNDYYIRNVNPRLRTLPVATGARLTLTRQTLGQGGGNAAGGAPVDLATVAANGRDHLFLATVQRGRIQRLEEQYIP